VSQQRVSGFEIWIEEVATSFFSFWNRHKVGILGTVALNLILAILFFFFQLKSRAHLLETMIFVDFESEYEIVPPKVEEPPEPVLPDDAVNPDKEWEAIKNIAVDATREDLNPDLYDEKNINADELYQEAQRVREQMQSNKELWEESLGDEEVRIPNVEEKNTAPKNEAAYKGPTVISYYLEGRKALRLPVPAYKCEMGGQVVIDIEVDTSGNVTKANIDNENSVTDECINSSAIEAALASRFTATAIGAGKQRGSITYLFVPQ